MTALSRKRGKSSLKCLRNNSVWRGITTDVEVQLCSRSLWGSDRILLVDPNERWCLVGHVLWRLESSGPTCHCEEAKPRDYINEMQLKSLVVIAGNNVTYPDRHQHHKIAIFPKCNFLFLLFSSSPLTMEHLQDSPGYEPQWTIIDIIRSMSHSGTTVTFCKSWFVKRLKPCLFR